MHKQFKTLKKPYKKLNDSFSDTEIEVRRVSKDKFESLSKEFEAKCSMGDGIQPTAILEPVKVFKPVRIREEMRIDLRLYSSNSSTSVRSACKIYPIEEVSEEQLMSRSASRTSLISREKQSKRQQEVQRIIEERKRSNKTRPKSRNAKQKSSHSFGHHEGEGLKTFYPSRESIVDPSFAENFNHRKDELGCGFNTQSDRFGSLSSFKKAQIHRFSNDVVE